MRTWRIDRDYLRRLHARRIEDRAALIASLRDRGFVRIHGVRGDYLTYQVDLERLKAAGVDASEITRIDAIQQARMERTL